MFCQKCGAELTQGALFCIKCGNRVPIIADFEKNEAEPDDRQISSVERSQLTDAVISFQGGNTGAFDTIYNESKKYVYYTILKTVADKDVADDILQETYLDVYKSLGQLQSPEAFKGWAVKIAQHKISRYFQKKNPSLFSSEEEMDDAIGDLTEEDMSALPEDAVVNKEVQRLISEIVDELPENQKSAVISYYYNQMSIPEIAESMGVPENTVKTYLFRGKKKIKDGVLEIEKKHGTKLYALPLAGLLGLLFTEEAKAAVVTTTASHILGAAAAGTATAGAVSAATGVSSATSGVTGITSAATSAVSATSGIAGTTSVGTVAASGAALGTSSMSSAAVSSAVTSNAVTTSATTSSAATSSAITSSAATATTSTVTSTASSTVSNVVSSATKTVAKEAASKARRSTVSVVIRTIVNSMVCLSVGICSTVYVMNNTEIRETIHEIPVIGKVLDIGLNANRKTFIGEWRSTADGNRMTINNDHTFIAVKADGSSPITGTWTGDNSKIVFREDLGLLGVVADTFDINIQGVYDPKTDKITINAPVLGPGEEVYERIDPESAGSDKDGEDLSDVKEPFVGRWKFGAGNTYMYLELDNDNGVLQEYSATRSDQGEPKGERKGKWSIDGDYIAVDFTDGGETFTSYLKYDHESDTLFLVDDDDKSLHEMIRLE